MSWPQWSVGTQPPLPAVLNPINPAPAVVPPVGVQYTPEQWAQVQQQNWTQWAQWQQQYQQWHQQYGAEYQKSLSALNAQVAPPSLMGAAALIPNVAVPPPLPAENVKPPLPLDDPPSQPGYVTGDYKPPLPSSQPPTTFTAPSSSVPSYSTRPPSVQQPPPPRNNPQDQQQQEQQQQQQSSAGGGWQNRNQSRFGDNNNTYQNNKRGFEPNNDRFEPNKRQNSGRPNNNNWSSNTQPPQQPPPATTATKPAQPAPRTTVKEMNLEELTEAEKKFDKQFADWEAQYNKWKEQNAQHPDKTQYKEYEKKWETWRAQLLERREQMKKKRISLMAGESNNKFKQLPPKPLMAEIVEAPKLMSDNVPPRMGDNQPPRMGDNVVPPRMSDPPPRIENAPPRVTDAPPRMPLSNAPSMSQPPPGFNDEPLQFKSGSKPEPPPEEENTGDFLKISSTDGIPGLDLAEGDGHEEPEAEVVPVNRENPEPAQKTGPDFEAISRGINTILGDQKLMNMLSMVSQNQAIKPSDNLTNSMSTIREGSNFDRPPFERPLISNEQSNLSQEEYSNTSERGYVHQKESINNFDDQTRSSFTHNEPEARYDSGGNFGRNEPNQLPQFSNKFGEQFDERRDFQNNRQFGRGTNNDNYYDGPQSSQGAGPRGDFNRDGPQFSQGPGPRGGFSRDGPQSVQGPGPRGEFNRDGPQSAQGPSLRGDFNRDGSQFSQGPGPRDFNREGPPSAQGPGPRGDFNREGPQSAQGPGPRGDFNREGPQSALGLGPRGDFNRDGPLSAQGPGPRGDFNRDGPLSAQGPGPRGDFNRDGSQFSKGLGSRDFNRDGPQSAQVPGLRGNLNREGPQSFQGRGLRGDFNRDGPQSSQGPGPRDFNRDGPQSSQGPGPRDFNRDAPQSSQGPGPRGDFSRDGSFNRDEFGQDRQFGMRDNFNQNNQVGRGGMSGGPSDRFSESRGDFGQSRPPFGRGAPPISKDRPFDERPFGARHDQNRQFPPRDGPNQDRNFGPNDDENDFYEDDDYNEGQHFDGPRGPSGQNRQLGLRDQDRPFGSRDQERQSGPRDQDRKFGPRDKDQQFGSRDQDRQFGPRDHNRPFGPRDNDQWGPGDQDPQLGPRGQRFGPRDENRPDRPFGNNRGNMDQDGQFRGDINSFGPRDHRNPDFRGGDNFEPQQQYGFKSGGDNFSSENQFDDDFQGNEEHFDTKQSHLEDPNPVESSDKAENEPNEDDLLKPATVIDYEHKSIKPPAEAEVLVSPVYMFDYRHKPLSRIPLPQRPKWLSETVKFIHEFDPPIVRPYEISRRYPPHGEIRNDDRSYPDDTRLSRDHRPFEDSRRPFEDSRRPFDDSRRPFDDSRRPFDDSRRPFEDSRRPFEDSRRPFEDSRRPFDDSRRPFDDSRRPFDDSHRPFDDNRRPFDSKRSYDSKFEDSKYDRKYEDSRHDSRHEKSKYESGGPDSKYSKTDRTRFEDPKPYKSYHDDKQDDDNFQDFDEEGGGSPPYTDDVDSRNSGSKSRNFRDKRSGSEDRRNESERGKFQERNYDHDKNASPRDEPTFGKNENSAIKNDSNTGGGSSTRTPTSIDDLILPPGRFNRPPRIVIILRGPPGSGKTFLAKLIKDKEVENGGSPPRILSLDDYFMVEHEKEVMEEGKRVKIKEMVYEYEEEMEESYRGSLMKSFKKTVTDGYFPFIIVDNVNDKIKYFGEMWSFAKQNGFQVYICQLDLDVQVCTKRNIHNRTEAEIEKCVAGWEPTPNHHPVVDATNLIQSGSISDVEMEEVNSPESGAEDKEGSEEEEATRSKWDNFDCSVVNLAKLDGVSKPLRPSRTMEEYLQLENEWTPIKFTKPGQKRVRWADLEEQKQQEKMRAIGFVVGQTNWERMMDPTMGSSALTQTKYIERANRY